MCVNLGNRLKGLFNVAKLSVSSVSGHQVSVSQARLEFTQFLFKSKIFNGNGQMVENGGKLNHHFLCGCPPSKAQEHLWLFLPSFILFISLTDVRPTRVVCFARGFLFQLGRAGMKTKWSLQFRCNETENQLNILLNKQRKKVMWHFWRISLQYSVTL